MLFPYYNEDIINLQYKTIEYINEDIIYQCNSRKRKRFNLFVENLINKNNDLIQKIRRQEDEDNNIANYEKVQHHQDTEIIDDGSSDTSDSSIDNDKKTNYTNQKEK